MRNVRKFIFLLSCFFSLSCPLSYASDSIVMEKADYMTLKRLVREQQSDLTSAQTQLTSLTTRLASAQTQSKTLQAQLAEAQTELNELTKSLEEQTKETELEKSKNKVYKVLLFGLSAYIIVK